MAQVLFFGASITQGVGDSEGGWVDRLKRELHQQMFKSGGTESYEVFNLGIAGNTSAMVLERMESEIKAREWHGDPFVFVVSIGTNDSKAVGSPENFMATQDEYQSNLQRIINNLKDCSDKILFVGLPPCDETKTAPMGSGRSYFWPDRISKFDAAMTEIAERNNLPKVHIFEPFLQEDWQSMLFDDGLHPNALGHQFIADKVRPELRKLLGLQTT